MRTRRVGSTKVPARLAKADPWRESVARRFKRHLDGVRPSEPIHDPDELVVVSKLPQRPVPRFGIGPFHDDD